MENLTFEITNNAAMQRAVARAKNNSTKTRARVLSVAERLFAIQSANNEKVYTVQFFVNNGKKLATCRNAETGELCKGLNNKTVCYHVATAAGLNIAIRSQMQIEEAKAAINAAPVPPASAEVSLVNAFCDCCPNNARAAASALSASGWFLGRNEQFCPNCND